jgi:hypothetical protein
MPVESSSASLRMLDGLRLPATFVAELSCSGDVSARSVTYGQSGLRAWKKPRSESGVYFFCQPESSRGGSRQLLRGLVNGQPGSASGLGGPACCVG